MTLPDSAAERHSRKLVILLYKLKTFTVQPRVTQHRHKELLLGALEPFSRYHTAAAAAASPVIG